jgi:hypothetical protein
MQEHLLLVPGIVAIIAGALAFLWSHDALHPMVILCPFLLYSYGIEPYLLSKSGGLYDYFINPDDIYFVNKVYFWCVCFFSAGVMHNRIRRGAAQLRNLDIPIESAKRIQLYKVSLIMGLLSVGSYFYALYNTGGFVAAYSKAKGGVYTDSGWISELQLLCYPAILLLALYGQEKRDKLKYYLLSMLFSIPATMTATFGGRRGPMFLILATFVLAWHIIQKKRPTPRTLLPGLAVISLCVLFVWSQRQHVYLGSKEEVDVGRMSDVLNPKEATAGSNYIFGSGVMLMCKDHNDYFWGKRIFVNIFIRPIPKQIWPDKYTFFFPDKNEEDKDIIMGYHSFSWLQRLGWIPLSGSSAGIFSDIFLEFKWGCLPFSYLFGFFLSWLWKRSVSHGGLWLVLYLLSTILYVYIPFQSLSAFYHRFLFISFFTILLWHFFFEPINWKLIFHRKPGLSRA